MVWLIRLDGGNPEFVGKERKAFSAGALSLQKPRVRLRVRLQVRVRVRVLGCEFECSKS